MTRIVLSLWSIQSRNDPFLMAILSFVRYNKTKKKSRRITLLSRILDSQGMLHRAKVIHLRVSSLQQLVKA